mmetsp:Transcript_927/g.2777  ORF Transcript_927/g.2777 Transcript_927/m.2777 type:complete len:404 (+) Transcript_927:82-1293(+)
MAGAANLAAAVASGADVTTVERLLAGNADISAVAGERRETALHFAARREPTLTSILLSAGASLDSTCTEGFTPLHAAAHAGAAQCLSILLAAPGVEACARTSRGDSALHLAAISGSGAAAALLLDAAPAMLEDRNTAGWTALMLAAGCAPIGSDAVCTLLDSGARDAPPRPPVDSNAMLLAASRGHAAALRALLQRLVGGGAAAAASATQAATSAGDTPLLLAARSGCASSVRLLLRAHANVAARNVHGLGPLDMAVEGACEQQEGAHCAGRHEQVLRLLLAAGAAPEEGVPALHRLAAAPAPLCRLVSLAATLRRAGFDTAAAARSADVQRRPALAAALRARRPPPLLLALRCPIDEGPPSAIRVEEGSPPLPAAHLEGLSPRAGAGVIARFAEARRPCGCE